MNRDEASKHTERALDELANALGQGQSESLVRYLDCLARFHRYSFGNMLLIAFQKPEATFVAGFQKWKELGRYVRAGEKGISILAPLIGRRRQDADTDANGDETASSPVLRGFKVAHVFDVSQTEGEPLPEFACTTGDPGEQLARMEQFARNQGIKLDYDVIPGGALGLSEGGRITVLPSLTPAETFSVLVHELAHELLHRTQRRQETTKRIRETEAEAVAYVVCRGVGLDCSTRSSDYIQLYSGDKDLLLKSLEHIQRTATTILTALERTDARPHPADVLDTAQSNLAAVREEVCV